MGKIIFVTGTDTGVGKTFIAASLLYHLRRTGVEALAMKPFCAGGRGDALLIQAFQRGCLSLDEINPFYFEEPVAPLVAARRHRRQIEWPHVLESIQRVQCRCDRLIVEGAGGLLVPLGESYTLAEIIGHLRGEVVVVSRDRLGTINHTLLTVGALKGVADRVKVVLRDDRRNDLAARTNLEILRELVAPMEVLKVPFLRLNHVSQRAVKESYKKMKKVLAELV